MQRISTVPGHTGILAWPGERENDAADNRIIADNRPVRRQPMAKHRIRRWFQFGVLDLLILTTIVAVAAVLWRSPRTKTYYEPLVEGTKAGQHWAGNGLRMKFRWCPAGDFKMGEDQDVIDIKLTR